MAKLWFLSLLCLAAALQVAQGASMSAALDNDIRNYLQAYGELLAKDDGTHKQDLEKLIQLTEAALQLSEYEPKLHAFNSINLDFSDDFNRYVALKMEDFQVTADIKEAISFYTSLLKSDSKFKPDIESALATLQNLLTETDVKQKEEKFESFDKTFSKEFVQFLQENNLPIVNRNLQNSVEFFEKVLAQDVNKYETEIRELLTKTKAALANVPVEEKQKALYEVTNPSNPELFEYLKVKYIELN